MKRDICRDKRDKAGHRGVWEAGHSEGCISTIYPRCPVDLRGGVVVSRLMAGLDTMLRATNDMPELHEPSERAA